MDPILSAALSVSMRWLHIASVIGLLGSFLYARFVLLPVLSGTPGDLEMAGRLRSRFRPLLYAFVLAILGSGVYNYLTKPKLPPVYHMLIGMKFLLVLHIFAVGLLYTMRSADLDKQKRWFTGIVISGLVIVALSAGLRYISTTQVIQ